MRFKFHTTILICFFLVNVASANTLKKGTSYQSFIYIGSHINSKLSATDGTIYSGNPIIKHIRSAGPTAEVWD